MNELRQAIADWAESLLAEPDSKGIFWSGYGHGKRDAAKNLVEFLDEWFDNYMKEAE